MQEFLNQHPALFIVAFAVFFLLVSLIAMAGVALAGGWSLLAKRYRTERQLPEHRRSLQRAQMRWYTSYNNILTFGSDSEGLYMAVPALLRLAHPTLFIPWSEIQVGEPKGWSLLTRRRLLLGPDAIPLRMSERLAQFLLEPRGDTNSAVPGVISSSF